MITLDQVMDSVMSGYSFESKKRDLHVVSDRFEKLFLIVSENILTNEQCVKAYDFVHKYRGKYKSETDGFYTKCRNSVIKRIERKGISFEYLNILEGKGEYKAKRNHLWITRVDNFEDFYSQNKNSFTQESLNLAKNIIQDEYIKTSSKQGKVKYDYRKLQRIKMLMDNLNKYISESRKETESEKKMIIFHQERWLRENDYYSRAVVRDMTSEEIQNFKIRVKEENPSSSMQVFETNNTEQMKGKIRAVKTGEFSEDFEEGVIHNGKVIYQEPKFAGHSVIQENLINRSSIVGKIISFFTFIPRMIKVVQ